MHATHPAQRAPGYLLPITLLLLMFSSSTLACGESRYRLGHGIRYAAYQAPLPATVLVYESATFESQSEGLQSAGHQVTVVTDQDQLLQALDAESYDVIIAPYSDMVAVQDHLGKDAGRSGLIPIVSGDSSERRLAKSHYEQLLKPNASLRKIARAVHKVMESQLR